MENLELLKEPFRTAYQNGDTIDYKINQNSKYCSYSAPGLHSISLLSYGNFGTVYTSDLNDEGKEIFFNMIEEGNISLWRIRAYINGGLFDYEDGYGWKTYDKEKGWTMCESPYKN